MSDDIDKLQRDYREIEAPAWLATRIAGELGRATRRRSRLPAIATAVVAAAAIALTPLLLHNDSARPSQPSLSLATVARMLPKKPPLPSPSLSRLKSVKTPPLPDKPDIDSAKKPQSSTDNEHDTAEEHFHAYS